MTSVRDLAPNLVSAVETSHCPPTQYNIRRITIVHKDYDIKSVIKAVDGQIRMEQVYNVMSLKTRWIRDKSKGKISCHHSLPQVTVKHKKHKPLASPTLLALADKSHVNPKSLLLSLYPTEIQHLEPKKEFLWKVSDIGPELTMDYSLDNPFDLSQRLRISWCLVLCF